MSFLLVQMTVNRGVGVWNWDLPLDTIPYYLFCLERVSILLFDSGLDSKMILYRLVLHVAISSYKGSHCEKYGGRFHMVAK